KASTKCPLAVTGFGQRIPMRGGLAGCCARAASGHAAAPPISVMNARRLIWPVCIRSPPARAGLHDIELAASSQRVSDSRRRSPQMWKWASFQSRTNSGRDGVRATFNLVQSARHQHCKYDGNENERGHISHQMTALGRIAEGLNAHDRPVN